MSNPWLQNQEAQAENTIGALMHLMPDKYNKIDYVRDTKIFNFAESVDRAIYFTDADGYLQYYNCAARKMWGWEPPLGLQRWCGSWHIYRLSGQPLPHDKCPMALALQGNRTIRGEQAIAERPNGSRVVFQPFPTPLQTSKGELVGGINLLLEVPKVVATMGQLQALTDRLATLNASMAPTLRLMDMDVLIDEIERVAEDVALATAMDLKDCCLKIAVLEQRLTADLDPEDSAGKRTLAIASSLLRDLGALENSVIIAGAVRRRMH